LKRKGSKKRVGFDKLINAVDIEEKGNDLNE
jgi:hypothetical protein